MTNYSQFADWTSFPFGWSLQYVIVALPFFQTLRNHQKYWYCFILSFNKYKFFIFHHANKIIQVELFMWCSVVFFLYAWRYTAKKLINKIRCIKLWNFGEIQSQYLAQQAEHEVHLNKTECTQNNVMFLRLSSVQSVPKYLCPKCVGATGWTSVVKMVMSGNSWTIDFAPGRKVKRFYTQLSENYI